MLKDQFNNREYQNNQRAGVPSTAYGVTRLTASHSEWLRHDGAGVRLTQYIVGTYRRDIAGLALTGQGLGLGMVLTGAGIGISLIDRSWGNHNDKGYLG